MDLYSYISTGLIVFYFLWVTSLQNIACCKKLFSCCKCLYCSAKERERGAGVKSFYEVVSLRTLKEEVYLVKKDIKTARQYLYGKEIEKAIAANKDPKEKLELGSKDADYLDALEAKEDFLVAQIRTRAATETE